ncbi:MAG: hypothetical protein KGZ71_09660 [Desulfobulbaceae bacterium]|nr:hypothetical protein [Candidatus Kapabacteria bacterium]MBS4000732.1 hypothetical protein [Desulfobulbaceae bacterium]
MTTTDKRIIISGAPFCYIHKLTEGVPSLLWTFDNLQNVQIVMPKADAAAQSSNNLDIQRGDGALFRFKAESLVLSGEDETDITPAEESSDATGKGKIVFTNNEAPLPTSINSFTAWLKNAKDNMESLLLISIATGFTHHGKSTGTPKVDGWARMLCKLNSDIDFTSGANASSIQLEFVSYKNPVGADAIAAGALEAITFANIAWKGKATNIASPVITAPEEALLLAGDIVLSPDLTYSYA